MYLHGCGVNKINILLAYYKLLAYDANSVGLL